MLDTLTSMSLVWALCCPSFLNPCTLDTLLLHGPHFPEMVGGGEELWGNNHYHHHVECCIVDLWDLGWTLWTFKVMRNVSMTTVIHKVPVFATMLLQIWVCCTTQLDILEISLTRSLRYKCANQLYVWKLKPPSTHTHNIGWHIT